ncbi:hypothetical protein [Streptomyces atratus]
MPRGLLRRVLVRGVLRSRAQIRHLVGEQLSEAARVGAANVVRNQHIGSGHTGCAQQLLQFGGALGRGARQVGRVAPARAAAVVEDERGEPGDSVVDLQGVQADSAGTVQEHHGRPSRARAAEEQAPSVDAVEVPQRGLV